MENRLVHQYRPVPVDQLVALEHISRDIIDTLLHFPEDMESNRFKMDGELINETTTEIETADGRVQCPVPIVKSLKYFKTNIGGFKK